VAGTSGRSFEVKFTGDTSNLTKSMKGLENDGKKLGSSLGGQSSILKTGLGVFAGNLMTGASVAIAGAIGSAVKAASAYETLGKKTEAVLKSTGNSANTSVKGIQALASNLESLSGVDEELIINSQNVLATFTKVTNGLGKGNDIFDQGTKAALNMSVALGSDLQGATIQIGKALNDPIKGVTALGRAGVQFTEDQKKQIKTLVASGDQLGAQKIILAELETQFGGVAEAAGKTFEGSMARMKDTVGDATRNIATALLPTLTDLADAISSLVQGDFTAFADKMRTIGTNVTEFAKTVINKIIEAWPQIKEQLIKWAGLFGNFLMEAIPKFAEAYVQFYGFVINKIVDALPAITAQFQKWVMAFSDWMGNVFPQFVIQFADFVLKISNKITAALPELLKKLSAWQKGFSDWVPGAVSNLLTNLSKLGTRLTEWISANGATLVSNLVQWAIAFAGFVIQSIPGLLVNLVKLIGVIGKWIVTDGIPGLLKLVASLGKAIVMGIWDGISKAASGFITKFKKWIKENLVDVIKRVLGIASPSKVFEGFGKSTVDGFIKGIDERSGKMKKRMAGLVADATKATTKALDKMNDKLTTAREKLQAAKDAFASFRDGVRASINGLLNFGQAASAETGTFLQNLRAQAKGIVSFAGKIQQLVKMGLSETAIQQILSAGAEAGTKIADELIKGGASAITETNALVKSVDQAAKDLGKSAADQFYKAGVTQGQAMVNGIIAAVKAAGFRIVGGVIKLPKDLQKALDSGKLSKKQVGQLNDILSGVPKLAAGGIVNKPTLAMIGEAGPEAVIPLRGRNAGMGATYNITVNAGLGTNGSQVGREIVDAIKKYERASGPVFASA
jgi:predicted translin family RNA/ssDNA-binding protein